MLSMERVRESRYRIVEIGGCSHATIAVVEGLKAAGCMLRFLKGAHLQPQEYQLVIDTMEEIDTRERMDGNAG